MMLQWCMSYTVNRKSQADIVQQKEQWEQLLTKMGTVATEQEAWAYLDSLQRVEPQDDLSPALQAKVEQRIKAARSAT